MISQGGRVVLLDMFACETGPRSRWHDSVLGACQFSRFETDPEIGLTFGDSAWFLNVDASRSAHPVDGEELIGRFGDSLCSIHQLHSAQTPANRILDHHNFRCTLEYLLLSSSNFHVLSLRTYQTRWTPTWLVCLVVVS
jgi:hypothetical protein